MMRRRRGRRTCEAVKTATMNSASYSCSPLSRIRIFQPAKQHSPKIIPQPSGDQHQFWIEPSAIDTYRTNTSAYFLSNTESGKKVRGLD
eukprot:COSAG04_NODE_2273_length_4414_cov_2.355968_4_plen_89_part_00